MPDKARLEKMLLEYAAGNLSAPETLVVAAHLALNGASREKVIGYESLGGQLIESEDPSDVCTSCLESVLEKIDGLHRKTEEPCATASLPSCDQIPVSIQDLLASSCVSDPTGWLEVRRGIEKMDLKISACPTRLPHKLYLMRLAPHQKTPLHRHHQLEITLVLDGEYNDSGRLYKKGDIEIIQDEDTVHRLTAGPEGCTCLVLTGGSLRFTAPPLRIWNLFSRF